MDQTIIDILLVRPRDAVFVPIIRHLLVVVTASEIILLGISFAGESVESDLIIHRTGLMFPNDDINMLACVGSRTGRIFAGGQDGNLYEFVYQTEEGWFTRKCRKINKTASSFSNFAPTFLRRAQSSSPVTSLAYDKDRNLLYALNADSTIQLYSLGSHDRDFSKIAHADQLCELAIRLCPAGNINRKTFKIVSIHTVGMDESGIIHLVAISSCGIKLYFTTYHGDQRAKSRAGIIADMPSSSLLDLVHVRLPAEESRHRDNRRLVHSWNPDIHTCFYSRGITLSASSISRQEDVLVAHLFNQSAGNPNTTGRTVPFEGIADVAVEGKVWDIQEYPHQESCNGILVPRCYSSIYGEVTLPFQPRLRSFLTLASSGVFVLQKTSPVEDLCRILSESNGNCESESLRKFVEAYSAEQACFFFVVIACPAADTWARGVRQEDSKLSSNLTFWCMNALLKFGGEPSIIESSTASLTQDYLASPFPGTTTSHLASMSQRQDFHFSPLHQGLYCYFSRLVCELWNKPISVLMEMLPNTTELSMTLHCFGEFLDRNQAVLTKRIPGVENSKENSPMRDAVHAENESIRILRSLVSATLELISLLSLCRDYNILAEPDFDSIKIDFEELVSTPRGREIVAQVGSSLVQKQLKMKSSVESLCQILLQRCPNFFGNSQIVAFHGTECLERAKQSREPSERKANLDESLKFFLTGCKSLSMATIGEIARNYEKLAYFPGVVQLCLETTMAHDPENVAWLLLKNPALQLNTKQQEGVTARDVLYSIVFDALKAVHGIEGRTAVAILDPIGRRFPLGLI